MSKVTDLTEISSLHADDVLHVVDVSDPTDDPAGSSFKVKAGDIAALGGGGGGGSSAGASKILLEEITLTTAGVIDFTDIPGGYTNLYIEGMVRVTTAATAAGLQVFFNNDLTETNYRRQNNVGNGAANNVATSDNAIAAVVVGNSAPANSYSQLEIKVADYADSGRLKNTLGSFSGHNNTSALYMGQVGMSHRTMTAPITSLHLRVSGDDIAVGSVVRLYGDKSLSIEDSETIVVRKKVPVTLSSGEFEIDLTDYQDGDRLIVKGGLRSDRSGSSTDGVMLEINSDTTAANYRYNYLRGQGSSVAGESGDDRLVGYTGGADTPADSYSYFELEIGRYAESEKPNAAGTSKIYRDAAESRVAEFVTTRETAESVTNLVLSGENGNLSGTLHAYIEKEGVLPIMTQIDVDSLPTGTLASPPTGMVEDDLWLDTTDSATHPTVRISTTGT